MTGFCRLLTTDSSEIANSNFELRRLEVTVAAVGEAACCARLLFHLLIRIVDADASSPRLAKRGFCILLFYSRKGASLQQ